MSIRNYWNIGILVLATGALARIDAASNPQLTSVSLGSEVPAWSWKTPPTSNGAYDADGKVFTLTGNGQGVYFCWDRAALAFVSDVELTGDFTFTARMAKIPEAGPGQVGILVKSGLDTRSPVLSLRWDYYWQNNGGNGLTWFNRITPKERIGLQDSGEKGNMQGTTIVPEWEGRGCLGLGFENRVPGFDKREDMWLRIQKIGTNYKLFARYGAGTWTEVSTVEQTGTDLGSFTLPQEGPVFAGLFVLGVENGNKMVTAEFDNIEIVTGATAGSAVIDHSSQKVAGAWKAYRTSQGVTLALPANLGMASDRTLQLYRMNGKKVADLRAEPGSAGSFHFSRGEDPGPGLFFAKVNVAGYGTKMIPVIQLGR